jgi:hypothetical protein
VNGLTYPGQIPAGKQIAGWEQLVDDRSEEAPPLEFKTATVDAFWIRREGGDPRKPYTLVHHAKVDRLVRHKTQRDGRFNGRTSQVKETNASAQLDELLKGGASYPRTPDLQVWELACAAANELGITGDEARRLSKAVFRHLCVRAGTGDVTLMQLSEIGMAA